MNERFTTTIENFRQKEKIERIDILKLDVEGAEIKALKGAHHKLSKHAVTVINDDNFIVFVRLR